MLEAAARSDGCDERRKLDQLGERLRGRTLELWNAFVGDDAELRSSLFIGCDEGFLGPRTEEAWQRLQSAVETFRFAPPTILASKAAEMFGRTKSVICRWWKEDHSLVAKWRNGKVGGSAELLWLDKLRMKDRLTPRRLRVPRPRRHA